MVARVQRVCVCVGGACAWVWRVRGWCVVLVVLVVALVLLGVVLVAFFLVVAVVGSTSRGWTSRGPKRD